MTPGSLGPGLAGEAGKSVLICRFNKCGECAHLWGKGWEEARAARQALGRGTATGKEDFMATPAQGGGVGSFTLTSSTWKILGLQKGIPVALGIYPASSAAAMPPSPPCWRSGKGLNEERSLTASRFLARSLCLLGAPFSHLFHNNRVHWETLATACSCSCPWASPPPPSLCGG